MVVITNTETGKVFITSKNTKGLTAFYPVYEFAPGVFTEAAEDVMNIRKRTKKGTLKVFKNEQGSFSSEFSGVITSLGVFSFAEESVTVDYYEGAGKSYVVTPSGDHIDTAVPDTMINPLNCLCTSMSKKLLRSPKGVAFVNECIIEMYDSCDETFESGVFSEELLPLLAVPAKAPAYRFLEEPLSVQSLVKQLSMTKAQIGYSNKKLADGYCLVFTRGIKEAAKMLARKIGLGEIKLDAEGLSWAKIAPIPSSDYLDSEAKAEILINCYNGIPKYTYSTEQGDVTEEFNVNSFVFFSRTNGESAGFCPGLVEYVKTGVAPWMTTRDNPLNTLATDISAYFALLQKNAAMFYDRERLQFLGSIANELDIDLCFSEEQFVSLDGADNTTKVSDLVRRFGDGVSQIFQMGTAMQLPGLSDGSPSDAIGTGPGVFGTYTFLGDKSPLTKFKPKTFRFNRSADYGYVARVLRTAINGDQQTQGASRTLDSFDSSFRAKLKNGFSLKRNGELVTSFGIDVLYDMWLAGPLGQERSYQRGEDVYEFAGEGWGALNFKAALARSITIEYVEGEAYAKTKRQIDTMIESDSKAVFTNSMAIFESVMHGKSGTATLDESGTLTFAQDVNPELGENFQDHYTLTGPSDCTVRRGSGAGHNSHITTGHRDIWYTNGGFKEQSSMDRPYCIESVRLSGLSGLKPTATIQFDYRPVATIAEGNSPAQVQAQIQSELGNCLASLRGIASGSVIVNGQGTLYPPTVRQGARDNAWDASCAGHGYTVPLGWGYYPDGRGETGYAGGGQFTAETCPSFSVTMVIVFNYSSVRSSTALLSQFMDTHNHMSPKENEGNVMYLISNILAGEVCDKLSAYIIDRVQQIMGNTTTDDLAFSFAARDQVGRLLDLASVIYFTNIGETADAGVIAAGSPTTSVGAGSSPLALKVERGAQAVTFFTAFKNAYILVSGGEYQGSVSSQALATLAALAQAADRATDIIAKPDFKPFYLKDASLNRIVPTVYDPDSVAYYMQYGI